MMHILLMLSFLLYSRDAAAQDLCVADYAKPQGPAGYSCKPPAQVTADDFVYSGLREPGNYSSLIKAAINTAFADQFPGINGLGIAMARADLAPGGVVPMHTHHGASETILVARGTVTAGFISSDNTLYQKKLKEGDIMVFPPGLLHFQANTGDTQALIWASFNSADPGIQIVSNSLFGNSLPTGLLEKITFVDADEVKRLKALFGGSGISSY